MRIQKPFRTMARALFQKAPLQAQLIITRRCNLSCGYCTEYDHVSEPIAFKILQPRLEALHRLKALNITLLGGEPLLHPRLPDLVAYANHEAQVSVTTNGFLLSDDIVERLNEAGLSNMQVSIDGLKPDRSGYIQKSMKPLLPKLERLRRLARFDVHVNLVLCESSKADFKATLAELRRLDFFVTVNPIHNDTGKIAITGEEYLELWEHHYQTSKPGSFIEYEYGKQLLQGWQPEWQCRAGARSLYVDEFGNVQFCHAQRGRLNKPLLEYTADDLRQHADTHKGCERGCSIFCVYRDSFLDNAPVGMARAVFQFIQRGGVSR